MLLLSERDVEALVEPAMAIASAREAYRLQATGALGAPGRIDLRWTCPTGGVLVLAGHLDAGALAVKANVHVHPDDSPRRSASLLTLWDAGRPAPLALISAAGFNDHRTAAGFAAAADRLAPREAATLAIFGAGKIAPATIRYIAAVRALRRVLIVSRGVERAAALAATAAAWPALAGVAVSVASDPAAAARDADILVTATTSEQPVFPGDAVRPGALVILGGANRPGAREADDTLIRRATIYADHREGALAKAGDLAIPLASGALRPQQIAGEIGAVLDECSTIPAHDILVFKSIGIAPQDALLARALLDAARRAGRGVSFDPVTGGAEA